MKWKMFVVLTISMLLAVPFAFGADETAKEPTKKYVIGMSQCNLGEPWRVQMNADVKAAADKHPELEVIFKDAQNKAEVQQAHIGEFVDQKVDLIIISPKEAKPLTRPVEDAMKAGIPVIGAGGVYSQQHADAMLAEGALAVQLDSVFWRSAGYRLFI